VATRAETGRVVLEVDDDGCGMTAEQRERIFDLFYTTKDPGRGIGLGLAMVEKTVADMGGAVTVDSQPDQGTRFTVSLPRLERSVPPLAEAAAPAPDTPAPDAG
jgi:signal transduction histidine kinase